MSITNFFSSFFCSTTPDSVLPDSYDSRDYIKEIPGDWKYQNPTNLLSNLKPEVLDQGSSSSCTGHAAAHFFSILDSKLLGEWISFNPWFFWNLGRKLEGNGTKNTGCQLRTILKVMHQYGALTDSSTSLWKNEEPSDDDLRKAFYLRIRSYQKIPVGDNYHRAIQYTLTQERLPILVSLKIYKNSWEKTKKGGVLSYQTGDTYTSSHAVVLVGFDGENYLALNSSGKSFGDNGVFKIDQSYLRNRSTDTWTVGFEYF